MTSQIGNSNNIRLQLSLYFLEREMTIYHNYLVSSEKPIITRIRKVEKNIDKYSQQMDESTDKIRMVIRRKYINQNIELDQLTSFIILLRHSFISTLYSFLELSLLRECFLDSRKRDNGYSYNKLKKQKGISKAEYYYSKIMKIGFPFDNDQDWLWIKKLKLLRDCIIHRQGSLSGFSSFQINQGLMDFIKKEEGLSVKGDKVSQVIIDIVFCRKANYMVKRIIAKLLIAQYQENSPVS